MYDSDDEPSWAQVVSGDAAPRELWADIVEEDDRYGNNETDTVQSWDLDADNEERVLRSWAQVVAGAQGTIPEDHVPEQPAALLFGGTRNRASGSRATGNYEAGEPIGIRVVQSILMSATQTNLSHFHTAGMSTSGISAGAKPSAAEAMDSMYTKQNTGMHIRVQTGSGATGHSASGTGIRGLRKHIVGASLGSFVATVGSSFTGLPERENVWYRVLGKPVPDNILRFYIDYKRMVGHGMTLCAIAQAAFGDDCPWSVSPDFMGMIDVDTRIAYMSSWLNRMDCIVCGTHNVLSCNVVDSYEGGYTAVTHGTNILAASRAPGVDKAKMACNNVDEVERAFGIEAAACVLGELVGSRIVSDFMTRTGTVLPFHKRSKEIQDKGLLTSMGFERPKEDIKEAVASGSRAADRSAIGNDNPQPPVRVSVYESIMTGLDPFPGFDIIVDPNRLNKQTNRQ
jgi:RNA polymerase Rpb1, domain 5